MVIRSRITRGADGEQNFGSISLEGSNMSFKCRGEADRAAATAHGNPAEDPALPYGDHPFGIYNVVAARQIPETSPDFGTYGPWFLALDPVEGEALQRKEAGAMGLGIHGGYYAPGGVLRATHGCLRVEHFGMTFLGPIVRDALARGEVVTYICQPEVTA